MTIVITRDYQSYYRSLKRKYLLSDRNRGGSAKRWRDVIKIEDKLYISYKPLNKFLLVLLLMFGLALLTDAISGFLPVDWRNGLFPILIMISCWVTAFALASQRPLTLLTPIPWFLIASGVFYGFGPLLYVFGNEKTREYAEIFWRINNNNLWQTNFLNLVGILVIVVSFLLVSCLLHDVPAQRKMKKGMSNTRLTLIVVLLLAVVVPVKYFYVMPYVFGVASYVPSMIAMTLGQFVTLGILLLSYLAVHGNLQTRLILFLLLLVELLVNFFGFSKQDMILVLIAFFLGRFLAQRRMSTLIWMVIMVVSAYFLLNTIFSQSRAELIKHENGLNGSVSVRVDILKKVIPAYVRGELPASQGLQFWWSRLSYSSAQAFAMNRYDRGYPGDSLENSWYSFVPRFIWPDKPSMTAVATGFNQLALGNAGSASGPGVFGEGYWNGGWLGAIGIAAFIGCLFALITPLILSVVAREDWIFLPCVLIGIRLGFRIDGWFVPDYFATPVIFVALYVGISIIKFFWREFNQALKNGKIASVDPLVNAK